MRVVPVPCLSDNYAYLLIDEGAKIAAVVDASEDAPVLEAVAREGVRLVAILSTHHHFDHVGGNEAIARAIPGIAVYGHRSDAERTPALDHPLDDGDAFSIGDVAVEAMHVPGHTLGAITFVARHGGEAWAFTGDTLFLAGCGRLFEGTPAQMHVSLARLAALPPRTNVACGHEYTESNLRFAAHVEPYNERIAARATRVAEMRARGLPTVPGTVAEELETNPFLRVENESVRAHVRVDDGPVETFAKLRREKDSFR
jgi:hydroxyacylglutathione hydrolase